MYKKKNNLLFHSGITSLGFIVILQMHKLHSFHLCHHQDTFILNLQSNVHVCVIEKPRKMVFKINLYRDYSLILRYFTCFSLGCTAYFLTGKKHRLTKQAHIEIIILLFLLFFTICKIVLLNISTNFHPLPF